MLFRSMRAVADSSGVPLCDLAVTLPKSLEYFYDDCHLNTRGAAEAGKRLAASIADSWARNITDDSTTD